MYWTSLFDDGRGYSHTPHSDSLELQDILQKKLDALEPEKEVRVVCGDVCGWGHTYHKYVCVALFLKPLVKFQFATSLDPYRK